MFVSEARSFARQARLAVTLAWVAGYTNIVTIFQCGVASSHVSGTAANLGRDLVERAWDVAGFAVFVLVAFFLGAAISGFCTGLGQRRRWQSVYVLPMILEAFLLSSFAIVVAQGTTTGASAGLWYFLVATAAAAMGLQNATIARISAGVVRTTHITGVLTDLGSEVSQLGWAIRDRRSGLQRGLRADSVQTAIQQTLQRLAVLVSILGTFILGAALGTLAEYQAPSWAMFVPVAFLCAIIYQDLRRPIAKVKWLQLPESAVGLKLPSSLAIYNLGTEAGGGDKAHRMPNLLAWTDGLPDEVRVVILDVRDAPPLDENAILQLSATLSRLSDQGRQLIVGGMSVATYRELCHGGVGRLLALDNVCPDMELAIARGLVLLAEMQPGPNDRRAA